MVSTIAAEGIQQKEIWHQPNSYKKELNENWMRKQCGKSIRRKTYRTRDKARSDAFDYIEMFYNPKRKHANNGMLSPINFEKQQKMKQQGV